METLRREAVYLWHYFNIQLEQIFWFWLVGILLGSIISVFGKQKIHGIMDALQAKKAGVLGVIPASIIGIASPLCMYGTIPISASFSEKGVRDDWLAAFMMSSILLNPQLIIYSAALGPAVLIVRIASCFLCGITAGLLVRFFYSGKNQSFFNFANLTEHSSNDTDPNMIIRLLKNIWRNIKITGPYFLIGIALSAAFRRYMPDSLMIMLFGGNKAFGLLMAATIGVPMYACGGGTIPLLQWWLADGMSVGAACAFMITGPAAKITNLGAVKIILGIKHFAFYLLFAFTFAFLSGLLVDLVIS